MKKYLKYIAGCLLLGAVASCSDAPDELTSVDYDRLFSPTELATSVRNRVNCLVSWGEVANATAYVMELYQGDDATGTLVRTDEVTTTSYTYEGLDGDTDYFVRVKAIGENITESKWVEETFSTDTEQIFEAVANADLQATQVTLRWPAGEEADIITLTPGDIVYHITEDDIAAGAATITNLTPETEYTAVMTRNGVVRGSVTFTTPIDLGGATAITPEDDFVAMLEGAEDGESFAFYPGTYLVPGETTVAGAITISSSITINVVDRDDLPVLNGRIILTEGASLTINDMILDGSNTSGDQAFVFGDDNAYDHLNINGCEIRNYTKGFFYVSNASNINSISIDNCLIHDIECSGGDLFDCRAGYIANFTLTNSTIWNSCASRDFIRMDDASGTFPGMTANVTVDHCTIDGVGSGGANYRFLYVRFVNNAITFTNNIVSNSSYKRGLGNDSKTSVPTFSNNNYWNTTNLVDGQGDGKFFDTTGTTLDPGYADAANGDFTLSNEDLIYNANGIGDPRWRQ